MKGVFLMSLPIAKKYISDFEQLGFGMFVHWGLYSQIGHGEWVLNIEKRDIKEYERLADTFTAEDFDAEELVLTAKNAGCKYITLTTRHHDGFSLYDTCGLEAYDAPHSAAKRDLIREFVDACNKYGIVPFFYHTTLDWRCSLYRDDFDGYLEYLRKSIEILCRNYGKIGGFWFDGNWDKPGADWKEDELYKTIRKYQPEAIIVNNTGLSERGKVGNPEIDSVTFEQGKPTPMDRTGMSKYLACEMCETMNDHWGCGMEDLNYKSPKTLIENLCECRKVGANYLLNIGPEGQGRIGAMEKAVFGKIGKWMSMYKEAVYNGRPYKTLGMGRNFMLKSKGGDKLYIFCFDIATKGDENVIVGGKNYKAYAFSNVSDKIKSIKWMDNNERLEFVQSGDMLCINCTCYPYGSSFCVRVAEASVED